MTRYSFYLCILLFIAVSANIFGNKTNIHVCEGDEAVLKCPPGQVIKIDLANFGRFSLRVCIDPSTVEDSLDDTICRNPRTLGIMQKKCDGKRECTQLSSTEDFIADVHPCPTFALPLYLDITYSCVLEETTTSTTTTTVAPSTTTPQEEQQPDVIIENKPSRLEETKPLLVCPSRTINGVEYPATPAGMTTNVRPCMDGATGESWWKCTDEGFWLGRYPNTTRCTSDWIFTKAQLLDHHIERADGPGVADFLRDLANIARGTIQAGDLPPLLGFIEKTISVLTNERWTLEVRQLCNDKMFELVYHLSTHEDAWTAWSVFKKREMADKLISYMEQVIAWSSGGDKPMTAIYARGHLIAQMSDFYENLKKSRLEFVSLPSSKTFDYIDDSIDVPIEAFKGADEKSVLYFSATHSMGAYFEPKPIHRTTQESSGETLIQRKVVSNIVTASLISKGKVKKVTDMGYHPLFITFVHAPEVVRRLSNPVCSWWDSEELEWQNSGCDLLRHNLTHTVCACRHMTHFAVLMDVYGHQISDFDSQMLTFLTYFGCSLSIVCLALTFICFSAFSTCGSDRVFIHKNLCAMLLIAELVFLLGIWRTATPECAIIAAILLFFFLSASTWMFLEGYQLYRMLVNVFPTGSKKWLFALIGYGFPAAVTVGAVIYDPSSFGTKDYCWLRTDNFFIFTFVGPAVVIFALNTVFLIMTLCIVCRHSSGGYLPCRHDSDTGRNVRTWVKGALGISCLLGVTWTFGLLWIDSNKSIVMAYAFTIANSLQGLFIFLFHVVFSDAMRKDIKRGLARSGLCGTIDSSDRKNNHQRGALSPSNGSGSGSELLYPSSEKYHSTPRRLDSSTPYGHQALMQQYQQYQQQLLGHQGTYDYATIQYGDMAQVNHHRSPRQLPYQHLDYRVWGGTTNLHRDQLYGYNTSSVIPNQSGQYHRPPPEFSPPPPPPQGVPRALYYASRRPPSSKMSDDSAYSEGGSSMLATEVTPTGATVLRMDLSKNPPVYCQDL